MRFARAAVGGALASALLVLASCYPFIAPLPSGGTQQTTIQHVPYSGTFSYTVDTGSTPRDVYFIFTNPSTTTDLSAAPTFASASIAVNGKSLPAPVPQALPSMASSPQTMNDRIAEFNRDPQGHFAEWGLSAPKSFPSGGPAAQTVSPAGSDHVGATATFYAADPNAPTSLVAVNATCQAVVGPVSFLDGRKRTLSVWVDDAVWNSDVNLTKVTDLAQKFLQSPESSGDIYHWDTAVVGEPWGPQSSSSFITWDANNTVTILLSRLNTAAEYSGGPVAVGYFWQKDNYVMAGSNERIMFYIDSQLYGATLVNGETGWQPTYSWPKIVFSTLAHEFQHMIQFYQKQVLRGALKGTDAWINEMCSMIMEDLVADKQNVEGPRGVAMLGATTSDPTAGTNTAITNARLSVFNQNSNLPLVVTSDFTHLTDYATAYAFGSWLARNYGGAELLRRIVQSPQYDASAVVNAVAMATGNQGESLATLLERWAASVLLSNSTSAPSGYRYNVGTWFTSSLDGESYNLGSIDLYNYSPLFPIATPATPPPPTTYHSSNLYYEAAASVTGSQTWNVTLPAGVVMNVVIR